MPEVPAPLSAVDQRELLASLALRRVCERYAVAVDRCDGVLLAAQFTEDGVLDSPLARFRGRESLRTVPDMVRERYLKTFHAVTNVVSQFGRNTAEAETYCLARHFFRDGEGQYRCYEMTIRYQDAFALEAGLWLLAQRRLVVDATRVFPVDERPR